MSIAILGFVISLDMAAFKQNVDTKQRRILQQRWNVLVRLIISIFVLSKYENDTVKYWLSDQFKVNPCFNYR